MKEMDGRNARKHPPRNKFLVMALLWTLQIQPSPYVSVSLAAFCCAWQIRLTSKRRRLLSHLEN